SEYRTATSQRRYVLGSGWMVGSLFFGFERPQYSLAWSRGYPASIPSRASSRRFDVASPWPTWARGRRRNGQARKGGKAAMATPAMTTFSDAMAGRPLRAFQLTTFVVCMLVLIAD